MMGFHLPEGMVTFAKWMICERIVILSCDNERTINIQNGEAFSFIIPTLRRVYKVLNGTSHTAYLGHVTEESPLRIELD